MSEKKLDSHGRWRSVNVSFRVSPEEAALINARVAASGLSKQDYLASRALEREVTVTPSSRVQRALRDQMVSTYCELRRIRDGSEVSPELEEVLRMLAEEFVRLGVDADGVASDVEREDGAIKGMSRG